MKKLLSPADVEAEGGPTQQQQAKLRMRPGAFCPFLRIGKHVYYERTEWDRWLSSKRRTHTRDAGTAAAA